MRNQLFIGAAVAALIMPAAVNAQEITSVIRGTVTNNGAPVAGATVTALNVPTGMTSSTTTDANGAFTFSGLRAGGPYTVSVNGNQAQVTDINTIIGTPYNLPIDLASFGGNDIVVTASAVAGAGNVSQGPATVLTAANIAEIATVNRDVRDLERRDPFARLDDTPSGGRAISFAGQNPRFNRFTVDGVPITDNFGLNPDGLPTRRSPIPLDAIGQFQTRVAPYDVREGNFQGGVINVILKSGTNDFHGTGFYSYSDDNLKGKKTKDITVTLPQFKSEDYGAELSGPIIKDKLFFMVAGERIRAGTPIPEGTIENNAGSPVPGLSQATVDQVVQIAKSKYNYDAGGVLNNSNDSDDRLVAKIDANLSDTQRAAITYTYTKDSILFNQNTFVTGSSPSLGLSSDGYKSTNRLQTGVFNLNSDWSDNFSTEFRAFYKDYKRGQDPIMGRGFAQFQICTAPTSDRGAAPAADANKSTLATACPSGVPSVFIGPDISRQSNKLTSQTFGGLLQARLTAGDHDFRAFAEYQNAKIYNLFLQRTAGDYYFDSLEDFANGFASRLRYQNAVPSLDPNDAAARFRYLTYTLGIQDNWRVTDTLNVSIGARYDLYGGHARPALNPVFLARYGFPNTAYIDGRDLFQPRFGFDWKPLSRLSLRGGAGIFGGGTPDVYVSNSFSTTGFLSNQIDVRRNNNGVTFTGADPASGAAILNSADGRTIPTAANNLLTNAAQTPLSSTNALDPNFKVPSQLRATLSADYDADLGPLGDHWRLGADFFYSKVRNQVLFTDIRSVPIPGSLTPDGRQRYTSLTTPTDTNSDIFLTDTNKGRTYIAVARFDKSWDFGLNIFGSFTYQDVTDQAPATSSTAFSNYQNGAFFDPNLAAYGISNDQVKYQFKYGFDFNHAFFGDYQTKISLFGESRIGHPFSYTFLDPSSGRSAVFGTVGSGSRYLLYVPTVGGDPLVSYADTVVNGKVTQTASQTQQLLEALINSTGLKNYQGKVAPRNAFHSKWFTKIDLHLEQELPTFVGKSRISVFADIENLGNLINKNWGQIQEFAFPYNQAVVRVACLTSGGAVATSTSQGCAKYQYTSFTGPTPTLYSNQSLYTIRIGARLTF